MAFTWPARIQYKTKETVSQILWTLKLDGDIEDRQCAVRVLMDRMAAHGVTIESEHALRVLVAEMEGGRLGDLVLRKINGRRTQGLYLLAEQLPENWLPDAPGIIYAPDDDEPPVADDAHLEPDDEPEPAQPPDVPEPPSEPLPPPPTEPIPAPPAATDNDLIEAALEAELAELVELRTPLQPVARPSVRSRIAQSRDLNDKGEVLNAILGLVGDLAVLVAGEPSKAESDDKTLDRLADAVERAERFRKRAVAAEETAQAKDRELVGTRRQVVERDATIATLERNLTAVMSGERVADDRAIRTAQQFIAARPHHRRGESESELVYTTGG
jgi:hypothetical protein